MAASLLVARCSGFRAPPEPSISFTKLPSFDFGSSDKLDFIEGRATGARPGQKVVLYAQSGVWWIQPLATAPFTTLQPGAVWKNRTHPGFAYAALLVEADYRPGLKLDTLPEKGGAVLAVATVRSRGLPPPVGKTILFAGYQWHVRQTPTNPGGTHNDYDPANAWTTPNGLLHLRIARCDDHWTSAEVNLLRSLGYGSYRFVIRNLLHLEPAVAFTMFTWDDSGPSREMDIEVSRWGEMAARNGQFVIQPYHVPANTKQFQVPAGTVTFMLRWAPGRASFKAFRGATSRWESAAFAQHVFSSGVPSASNESVHLNLYVFGSKRNPLRQGTEVIVEEFEYLP